MKRTVSLLALSLTLFFALSLAFPGLAHAQQAPDFDLTITITDQGRGETPLLIGLDPEASDGYEDDNVGPPALPPGEGFAALIAPGGESNNFITDTRRSVVGPATFEYEFIYQTANDPIEIAWDNAAIPAGVEAEIVDPLNGTYFQYDMNANSSLSIDAADGTGPEGIPSLSNPLVDGMVVRFTVLAAPEAPSSLGAAAASASQIDLSWDDAADNEASFEIERAESAAGPFSALATKAANVTSHTDGGLPLATEYCYRVRAVNEIGASAFSEVACAETPAGTLSFAPDALSFALVEGAGPEEKSFAVSSSISGDNPDVALSVQGSAPAWLDVPASTTAGTDATLSVDASSLAPGSYEATVTASANGYSDAALDVTLNVTEMLETDFTFVFEVSDTNGGSIALELGTAPEASDGEDALDQEGPPPPVAGAFDARFAGFGEGLFRDYRPTTTATTTWLVEFQASSGGAPVTLDWSGTAFPDEGRFTLSDIGGSEINVDMRAQSSYTVNLLTLDKLKIVYSLTSVFDAASKEGWNMVALPLDVADKNYASVFSDPAPETQPFGFTNTYEQVSELELGDGYWMEFDRENTQTLEGFDVPTLALNLSAGWSMIGGVSCDVPLSSVSDPDGIIEAGSLFEFDLAYNNASVIKQGRGYWVKAREDGQVVLDCADAATAPAVAAADAKAAEATEGMGRLSFQDADGVRQMLLMGAAPAGRSFDMPPLPPRGAFDVRFAGDTRLLEASEGLIEMQAGAYPLEVQLSGAPAGYVLEELRGGVVTRTHTLGAGEAVVLSDASVSMLRLRTAGEMPGMPESFAVRGNAPNPFSGSTTLTMDLPKKAQVAVDVYDVLGRRVLSLPGRSVEAGSGQGLQLDAATLTPGLYLYRVQVRMDGEVVTKTGRMTLVR